MKWIDIKGYNGYLISEYGDIKRMEYTTKRKLKQGLVDIVIKEKSIKTSDITDTHRYKLVNLSKLDGSNTSKLMQIHRLVYENFIGDILEGYVIDHIDNDRRNNHYSNLQMIKQSENAIKYFTNNHYENILFDDGKICKTCKVKKPTSEFHLRAKKQLRDYIPNKWRSSCKNCVNRKK